MSRRDRDREGGRDRDGKGGRGRDGKRGTGSPVTVTVCRGCCCGTEAKHPGVDHAGQYERLRTAVGSAGRVRAVTCLDVCTQSNVVVVGPSTEGRAAGGRPVWLGFVLMDEMIDDIAAWVHAGGPGLADPPGLLDLQLISVSRRVREGLAE
ncbi:(2Fe-2S) ferredoxin domain-containing protein [Kitasatospora aureofaciens]|uniref:(2Fe-2S) ferredoxin domain-containing protein n=1 Tax=Kitasatospora aureofaciens TaxID=1894 RepID=UPI001D63369B|nr:(2Fe-2S) ferredoxin domain-containing protein [Kitasatospora aureofaciens]HJD83357.1 (2Fe-2S) ferredoxin domain-containing protein [Kitasatospora aureofaciens]